KKYNDEWDKIKNLSYEELVEIPGIGNVMANNYVSFFSNEKNKIIVDDLLKEVVIEKSEENDTEQILDNMIFVITGSVERFKNRDELKEKIEERGGKVTNSVTSKTNYLINNDNLSNSSKNKKAKELNIKIITENQFVD